MLRKKFAISFSSLDSFSLIVIAVVVCRDMTCSTPFFILLSDMKDCSCGVKSSTDTACRGGSPSFIPDGSIVIVLYVHICFPSCDDVSPVVSLLQSSLSDCIAFRCVY